MPKENHKIASFPGPAPAFCFGFMLINRVASMKKDTGDSNRLVNTLPQRKEHRVGLFTNAGRRGSGSPSPEGKKFGRWRPSQSYRFVNKRVRARSGRFERGVRI